MKLFIGKCFAFALLVAVIFAAGVARYKAKLDLPHDYMASILDKHQRLISTRSNRVLLVGGSNVAFGIDSENLEERLGMPVVNMAIHAGLGAKFMLREASEAVSRGDVVVVCLEYALYSGYHETDLIEHTQLIYPPSRDYCPLSLEEHCVQSVKHFRKALNANPGGFSDVYNRGIFDARGDVVVYLDRENNTWTTDQERLGFAPLDDSVVQEFRDLAARCKIQGAEIYLTFPPYPQSYFPLDRAVIEETRSQIAKKLTFITPVGAPSDFVMDDSDFYNSRYHLNAKGKKKRTALLAERLTPLVGVARSNQIDRDRVIR